MFRNMLSVAALSCACIFAGEDTPQPLKIKDPVPPETKPATPAKTDTPAVAKAGPGAGSRYESRSETRLFPRGPREEMLKNQLKLSDAEVAKVKEAVAGVAKKDEELRKHDNVVAAEAAITKAREALAEAEKKLQEAMGTFDVTEESRKAAYNALPDDKKQRGANLLNLTADGQSRKPGEGEVAARQDDYRDRPGQRNSEQDRPGQRFRDRQRAEEENDRPGARVRREGRGEEQDRPGQRFRQRKNEEGERKPAGPELPPPAKTDKPANVDKPAQPAPQQTPLAKDDKAEGAAK